MDLRKKFGKIESLKATIVSLCIMVLFLLCGDSAVGFLGIDVASFSINNSSRSATLLSIPPVTRKSGSNSSIQNGKHIWFVAMFSFFLSV